VTTREAREGWVTELLSGLPSRRVRTAELKVSRGPDKGARARVERTRFRVGALPSNDLQLRDPAVSGHHFELVLEEKGFRIRDLGSRNGTVVGDVQVLDAMLPDRARIQVGDSRINFEVVGDSVELPASGSDRFGPLIGRSFVMRELFADLERIAKTDSTVLIVGETGTGKEAVAEAIVAGGSRADGPLVVVDCGALAPTLVEAELFGHEKGAFTGATGAHAGAFERADGGTVLLDEIGELPLSLQPRLLRVLEAREVQRLGGQGRKKVDIRLLAATHRALEEQVNRGQFRADLFYRLSVLTVRVPPLRERRDDIPLLARHFLQQLPHASLELLDEAILERLQGYSWPGNVRELRNAIERLALGGDPLGVRAAPLPPEGTAAPSAAVDLSIPYRLQKERLIADFERRYAQALLEYSPDNLARAARKAGLDRMAVVKLLGRHGLLGDEG
jgi:transcriptional regulator with GAF, ATPase, and Fis domain